MFNLVFSNTVLLAGLAALAIPVLIHLLLKQKPRKVRFSTVKFLVQQDKQAAKKRKLRHLALLAVRLLLLALIVFAFARPYLPERAAAGTEPPARQIVFLLDASASMQAPAASGKSRWAEAVEHIGRALSELTWEDKVMLLEARGDHPPPASWLAPPKLAEELEKTRPGFGEANGSAALESAVAQLQKNNSAAVREIHLLSDLQKASWNHFPSVPEEILLKVIPLGDFRERNRGLLGASLSMDPPALRFRVLNYSRHQEQLSVQLFIDDQLHATEGAVLPAGAQTNLVLRLPALAPGWRRIEARLSPSDPYPWDDAFYAALRLPPPIQVWCVEDVPSSRSFEEKSFFIMAALESFETHALAPFDIQQITPEHLVAQIHQKSAPDLVIVPALNRISPTLSAALEQHARRGGGLLLFLGPEINPSDYNHTLAGLLPAQIGRIRGSLEHPEEFARLAELTAETPAFQIFANGAANVSSPVFRQRYHLLPAESASVLALLDDGAPFLLEQSLGDGRVALVNTSADASWTDWPQRRTFLPWLHQFSLSLIGRESLARHSDPPLYLAGTWKEMAPPPDAPLRWSGPDGQEGLLTEKALLELAHPGFYKIHDQTGGLIEVLPVNLPPAEMDLAAFAPEEWIGKIPRSPFSIEVPSDELASGDQHLWKLLLLCGALLLFFESFLSNRTSLKGS